MLFRTPEDTYQAYQRFAAKGNFRKAYHCLESLLRQFPGDVDLMVKIVNLTLYDWGKYELGRPWLIDLTKFRSFWGDYAQLSRGEVEMGNNRKAREFLTRAKELLRKHASPQDKTKAKEIFSYIENRLEYNEWRAIREKSETKSHPARTEKSAPSLKTHAARDTNIQGPATARPSSALPSPRKKQEGAIIEREKESFTIPSFNIPVSISPPDPSIALTNPPGFLSSLPEIKLLM
ncbi:MAG: hypothetical protein MUP68_09745, partial [Deltaproteobacteria bacterium]|nr:hypothetical protein [Deltaproteobacteria bacterium]